MADTDIPAPAHGEPTGPGDHGGGLPAGTQLNGTYEIGTLIATGGMGEVYRGHVIETGDIVAIKVIRSDMAGNDAALALFRKEASALHRLNHDAIIRYYVVAIDPGLRRPYLAMEFVDGEPLSDILKRGALPGENCQMLLDRLAAGLQAAHDIGIIHRDISPDNIIVPNGDVRRAKIIDFGIAKSTVFGAATVIGDGFAGKYSYVSPEQLGLYGGDVTPRSDMYSLALVIAEASAGRAVDMGANHAQTIDRRRTVPALDDVAPELQPILHHMLQPEPQNRPDSMQAVRSMLRAAPAMDSSAVRPDQTVFQPSQRQRGRLSAMEAAQNTAPRQRTTGVIAAGLAALAIAAGAGGYFAWPQISALVSPSAPAEEDPYMPLPKAGAGTAGLPQLMPSAETAGDDTGGDQPADLSAGGTPPRADPPAPAPQQPRPADSVPAQQPAPAPQPASIPPVIASAPTAPPPLAPPPVSMPPVIASAPTAPPPPAPPAAEPAKPGPVTLPAQPARDPQTFIARYPQAPCLFYGLRSAGAGNADIEAFGTSVQPVEAFDAAFKSAFGYEASIQFRPVSAAQCPAVEFLRRVPGDHNNEARIELPTFSLKPKQVIEATVHGVGLRHVSVLIVTDDGYVQSLPVHASASGRETLVTISADAGGGSAAQRPKVMIVILSLQRPKSLPANVGMPANQLFPLLAQELSREADGVTVLRQYLRVEG